MTNLQAIPTSDERVNPWMVLSVTSLGVLLVMLNLGALNVALPTVTQHFHAGAMAANWILLSFMLVNTVLILVFGQLADIFGRGRLYLAGITVFTAASFLLGFSPNVWILIALRAVQAAGGALIITNNTALITDAFPEEGLGTGLGINVFVSAIAQLLGPVVGGLFAAQFGWRWVFWFSVPLGVIGLVWGLVVLRHMRSAGSHQKVDALGNTLAFLMTGGLILALSEGSVLGWSHPLVICGFVVFIGLLPVFVWHERRAPSPMIDFNLFRKRSYTMANLAAFFNAFARVSVVLLMGLYLQAAVGLDTFRAGIMVLPVTIGMLLSSPLAGSLANRYHARVLSSTGLVGSAIGMLLLVVGIGPKSTYWPLALGMFLVGFGSGLFLTPNTRSIMTSVPAERRGIANGLRSMLQNMGQVLSTATSLMLVTAALPLRLKDAIYQGAAANLSVADVERVTTGYRLAFLVLLTVTVMGVFASLLRDRAPAMRRSS